MDCTVELELESRVTPCAAPLVPQVSAVSVDNGGTEKQAVASFLLPSFVAMLQSPNIRTVLICGCGGGFDFVHGLALMPEIEGRLDKRVIISSYSFGDPDGYENAPVAWTAPSGQPHVRRVTAASRGRSHYAPEGHACAYLDASLPKHAPHEINASYARDWTVPLLRSFYEHLVSTYAVDAVVLVDGGSDSLMVGDEAGLGDPIEDAVSIAAVATLANPRIQARILMSIGLGCDRFNGVTDAATLRAVAELTRAGGFLGSVSMERDSPCAVFYRSLVESIFERQDFHSVLAGAIVAASLGWYGDSDIPESLRRRVAPGSLYIWPLMAHFWAFSVAAVARRSMTVGWISQCETAEGMQRAVAKGRTALHDAHKIRKEEMLPGCRLPSGAHR